MNGVISKGFRCAVYTRKSTEHNLDLAFTSLDAQREACEAYGIGDQRHRLDRWMRAQVIHPPGPEAIDAGIMPDVGSRPPMPAELNVVEVGLLARTEHRDHFVLGSVKRALAGIRLHPHHDVEDVPVHIVTGRKQLRDMPPVDADVMQRRVPSPSFSSIGA